jgi:hypothetical protein
MCHTQKVLRESPQLVLSHMKPAHNLPALKIHFNIILPRVRDQILKRGRSTLNFLTTNLGNSFLYQPPYYRLLTVLCYSS